MFCEIKCFGVKINFVTNSKKLNSLFLMHNLKKKKKVHKSKVNFIKLEIFFKLIFDLQKEERKVEKLFG